VTRQLSVVIASYAPDRSLEKAVLVAITDAGDR
jgi:hypothetical protein